MKASAQPHNFAAGLLREGVVARTRVEYLHGYNRGREIAMLGWEADLEECRMVSAHARRVWVAVAWIGAVTATAVNGVIVGYGAVMLQFFGESADAEDYRISAGGYGAAAAVLGLSVIGILTHRAPRCLAWVAALSALVLSLLAARSAAASVKAESVFSPIDTAWDGIGGVLWAPWTWVLVALGIHGLYRLRYGARRAQDPR